MRKKLLTAAAAAALLGLLPFCLTGCGAREGVTIGSKQFTENILLGEMYAQLIEARTDIPVTRKLNLGGVQVCMPAMEKAEIDMYFEYTGTAFNEILDHELFEGLTTEDIFLQCKAELDEKHDITMFDPLGLNNTFALAVKTSRAEELGLSKISDLAPVAELMRFGADHFFFTRAYDGYDGMVDRYGVYFAEVLRVDTALMYEAADKGELDVIVVYSTDSLLKKYDLTCLEDDLSLFPPYEGTLLCRNGTLEKYPELRTLLNALAGGIDDETMQQLNYEVDVMGRSVEEVAGEFLAANNYL